MNFQHSPLENHSRNNFLPALGPALGLLGGGGGGGGGGGVAGLASGLGGALGGGPDITKSESSLDASGDDFFETSFGDVNFGSSSSEKNTAIYIIGGVVTLGAAIFFLKK